MTAFFLYFETKNESSTDYRSFANVGAFVVPKTIDSGKMPILLHGKPLVARMISDGSNHGIADYFCSNKQQIRDTLLAFIHARVQNDAVIANLMKFIYNNQEMLTLDDGDAINLAYAEFEQRFDPSLFERGPRPGGLAGIRKPAMKKRAVPLEIKDIASSNLDALPSWRPDSREQVFLGLDLEIGLRGERASNMFHVRVATPEALRRHGGGFAW